MITFKYFTIPKKVMANITLTLEEYQDILERIETLEEKFLTDEGDQDNIEEDFEKII